jgi:hypothetical protein
LLIILRHKLYALIDLMGMNQQFQL